MLHLDTLLNIDDSKTIKELPWYAFLKGYQTDMHFGICILEFWYAFWRSGSVAQRYFIIIFKHIYIHASFILNEKYLVCKVFLRMPYPWRKLSSIISPGIGHSRLVDHSTIQSLWLDGFHSQLQQDFLHPTTVSCLKPSVQSWRFNHPPQDIPLILRLCQQLFVHQYPHCKVESSYHVPRPSK